MHAPEPWLTLLLLTLCSSPARSQEAATDHETELARNRSKVIGNGFQIDRGYHDYTVDLPGLAEDIATWTHDMKIVDAGAGEAGFFGSLLSMDSWRDWYLGYWGRKAASPLSMPRMVAVGVTRPESKSLDQNLARHGDRLSYVEGELGTPTLETEQKIGLGTVDRVICVFGATSYAPHFDAIIASYARLLKTGGTMRFFLKPSRNVFQDVQGRSISIVDYLSNIRGLKVLDFRQVDGDDDAYLVERTAEALDVTPLELVRFRTSHIKPPVAKEYREARAIPNPRSVEPALGQELLSRLGQTVDLGKEPKLARELETAGVSAHGAVLVDVPFLERAIHSDWKSLASSLSFSVGDLVPVFKKGTGRILEALPGDRFRIAGPFDGQVSLVATRDELAVELVAQKVVAFETAQETLRNPARMMRSMMYGLHLMRPDDRAYEIAKAFEARGLVLPGPETPPGLTDWERAAHAHERQQQLSFEVGDLLNEAHLPDHKLMNADLADELPRAAQLYLDVLARGDAVRPVDPSRLVPLGEQLLREPVRGASLIRTSVRTTGVGGALGGLLEERVRERTKPENRVVER
jgi:hypothetical protein